MIGKVSHSQPMVLPPEVTNKTTKSGTSNVAQVELSSALKSLQSAKTSMDKTSDVDMNKVAEMKALLGSGKVSVNLDNLAGSMLDFYQDNE
ncbi:flagellar biosynthesis anti-sigma factor FlgM [Photobacterium sagamiensis]|uniref:flagellar biosynthesis anti-sigma factor FlgM n=1 Tax=Photobacterium sagamiensis TaxID=2910241 RepID=UPI003D0FE94A